MLKRSKCPKCGIAYWGDKHACPADTAPAKDREWRDPTDGEAVATAGCCLTELACWTLPFGCLTLAAAIVALISLFA
jgi:hypothetical protein